MQPIFLLILLGSSLAIPEGYYHQQYQYSKSSSSYKNNELQHKDAEEGFYSKQQEGNNEPKVNSYNQHVEYKNPNLENRNLDDFGKWNSYGTHSNSERFITTSGSRRFGQDQYGFDQGLQIGNLGSGTEICCTTYGSTASLTSLTNRLEDEMSAQLRAAIANQKLKSTSWSTSQAEAGFQSLQNEIRQNLTSLLQQELHRQYGVQGKRGPYSYSITASGGYAPKPNYDTRELAELTTNLEEKLRRQLQQNYRDESYLSSINTQSSGYQSSYDQSSNQQQSGIRTSYGPYTSSLGYNDAETVQYGYRPNNNYGSHKTESHHSSLSSKSSFSADYKPIVRPQVPLTIVTNKVEDYLEEMLTEELNRQRYVINNLF